MHLGMIESRLGGRWGYTARWGRDQWHHTGRIEPTAARWPIRWRRDSHGQRWCTVSTGIGRHSAHVPRDCRLLHTFDDVTPARLWCWARQARQCLPRCNRPIDRVDIYAAVGSPRAASVDISTCLPMLLLLSSQRHVVERQWIGGRAGRWCLSQGVGGRAARACQHSRCLELPSWRPWVTWKTLWM